MASTGSKAAVANFTVTAWSRGRGRLRVNVAGVVPESGSVTLTSLMLIRGVVRAAPAGRGGHPATTPRATMPARAGRRRVGTSARARMVDTMWEPVPHGIGGTPRPRPATPLRARTARGDDGS